MRKGHRDEILTPDVLLDAYRIGFFPMAENRDGPLSWYSPDPRGIIPLSPCSIPRSVRKLLRSGLFEIRMDTCFEQVIRACALTPREGQDGSWISEAFIEGYTELHRQGLAHSMEVWQNGQLVGGLYGLALGRIFFGESMFAQAPNASKAGFITLVRALEHSGFWLVDCQQHTQHLESLGARGISRELFLEYLAKNVYERTLIGAWTLEEGGILVKGGDVG